jgi:hypothetical protein
MTVSLLVRLGSRSVAAYARIVRPAEASDTKHLDLDSGR